MNALSKKVVRRKVTLLNLANWESVLLIAVFLLVLFTRLYFAFQTPNFETDEAYFNIRQIEHIHDFGKPLVDDSLSYGGRKHVFLPFFHYILGFFSLLMPLAAAAKILPNVFASTIVFIVFFISRELTRDSKSSLFAAFAAGFIPAFFSSTINNVSIYSFVLPLFFLTVYFFIKSGVSDDYAYYCLFFVSLLILLHPSSLILVFGFLLYLVFVRIEKLRWSWVELEISVFSVFLGAWFYFIVFKKAIQMNAHAIIWQNTPSYVLNQMFSKISIIEAIYLIGIIPFIFGIYVIYTNMFGEKKKAVLLFTSVTLVVSALLWLRLIKPLVGIYFLGTILVIVFSRYCRQVFLFIEKTKASQYNMAATILLFLVLAGTSAVPSFFYAQKHLNNSLSADELSALTWLKDNAEINSTIISGISEGHFITAVAQRKSVADTAFLLIRDVDERAENIHEIYSTEYETRALPLLLRYNVNYIYLSGRTAAEQEIDEIRYVQDRGCFMLVYDGGVKIYKPVCKLRQIT